MPILRLRKGEMPAVETIIRPSGGRGGAVEPTIAGHGTRGG